jgi:hypothetical protein
MNRLRVVVKEWGGGRLGRSWRGNVRHGDSVIFAGEGIESMSGA